MSSSNNSNNNNNRIPVNCGIYLKRGDAIDTNCCFIITMMCLLQHKVFESRDTFFDFIIFRTGNLTPSLKERITKESKPHKMISDDFIPIISRFFGIKITLVSDGISREIGDDDNKEHYYVFYENNHYQPMLSRSEVIERKEWINANKKMQETLENKLISNDDKYARSLDKSTSATATSTSTATVTATATATSTATSTVTSTETSKNDSISFTSFLERLEQAKRMSLKLFKRKQQQQQQQQQEKDFELALKFQINKISNFESNSNSFDAITEEGFVIV